MSGLDPTFQPLAVANDAEGQVALDGTLRSRSLFDVDPPPSNPPPPGAGSDGSFLSTIA